MSVSRPVRMSRRALLTSAFACATIARSETVRALASEKQSDSAIEQPLRDLYAALEAAMRAGRSTPFGQRFDTLAPAVEQAFDLETVLKVSVGLRWDSMDAALRARLLKAFRRFTIATYVANFDKFDGEHFALLPGLRASGTDQIVATEIITGTEHMRLDYVMRYGNGMWRAVDVLLEGSISRVAVQRSDFRKILANGDADALITSLHRKISDLSEGALNS